MKHYKIRITDSYGTPRIVTVKACSAPEALCLVEIAEGEVVAECREVAP